MNEYNRLLETAWPGDLVTCGGKVFKITKTNTKNYKAVDESGATYTVPIRSARIAPEGTEFHEAPKPETPKLVLGTAVRFKGNSKFPGTYVVIKVNGDDRYSFAKLGGDANRYVRGGIAGVEIVEV